MYSCSGECKLCYNIHLVHSVIIKFTLLFLTYCLHWRICVDFLKNKSFGWIPTIIGCWFWGEWSCPLLTLQGLHKSLHEIHWSRKAFHLQLVWLVLLYLLYNCSSYCCLLSYTMEAANDMGYNFLHCFPLEWREEKWEALFCHWQLP